MPFGPSSSSRQWAPLIPPRILTKSLFISVAFTSDSVAKSLALSSILVDSNASGLSASHCSLCIVDSNYTQALFCVYCFRPSLSWCYSFLALFLSFSFSFTPSLTCSFSFSLTLADSVSYSLTVSVFQTLTRFWFPHSCILYLTFSGLIKETTNMYSAIYIYDSASTKKLAYCVAGFSLI